MSTLALGNVNGRDFGKDSDKPYFDQPELDRRTHNVNEGAMPEDEE